MSDKNGIGIIRVPAPDKDRDVQKKAIQNITTLSTDIFDDIIVFDNSNMGSDDITNVSIPKSKSKSVLGTIFFHLLFQLRLAKAFFHYRSKIDVTFWHAGGYSLILPIILSKFFQIKVVIAVIGEPTHGYKNRGGFKPKILASFSYLLERSAYLLADRIIVFSQSLAEYELLKGFKEKVYSCPFNFEEVEEELTPINERDNLVVYLGRICSLKGADALAEAVKYLTEDDIESIEKIIFVGDGNLKSELERDMNNKPEMRKFTEFTGWVDHDKAMQILGNATLFVLPSESEGLPKALQEAMARGLIPVVTPVGSIPDFVIDGENGIILPDNDPVTVKNGLERAINSDQQTLSSNAKNTAVNEFQYANIKETFKEITKFDD